MRPGHGYAFVDKRLFLPERWFTEAYAARRTKCKVPDDLTFHTKPQLAVEILRGLYQEAMLPFKYIVADCLYGNSPEFIDSGRAMRWKDLFCVDSIRYPLLVTGPRNPTKALQYKGEMRAKRVVRQTEKAPLAVTSWPKASMIVSGIGGKSLKGPKGQSSMSLPRGR